jgi:hypothetical protein
MGHPLDRRANQILPDWIYVPHASPHNALGGQKSLSSPAKWAT